MANERYELILDAKETASQKIAALQKQLAALGGPDLVKANAEIKKLERSIGSLSPTVEKSHGIFTRFTQGIAVGNIVANAVVSAFGQVKAALLGTIGAAAESEKVWTQVTAALTRHGLATDANILQARKFADSMQTLTGIADEEYGRAIITMVDRGATLEQSFKLVAAASDIAASKNKDVTRVLNEMADTVGRGKVDMEKYGVTVDNTAAFSTQLDQALTQLSNNFGGAATAAANEYGVRVETMQQKLSDLQENIGSQVLPVLKELTNVAIAFIDEFNAAVFGDQFNAQGKLVVTSTDNIVRYLRVMKEEAAGWVKIMVGGGKVVSNAVQLVADMVKITTQPMKLFLEAAIELAHGDFKGAWDALKSSFTDTGKAINELDTDFTDLIDGIVGVVDGVKLVNEEIAWLPVNVETMTNAIKTSVQSLVAIPKALDDMELAPEKFMPLVSGNEGAIEDFKRLVDVAKTTQDQMIEIAAMGAVSRGEITAQEAIGWMDVERAKMQLAEEHAQRHQQLVSTMKNMTANAFSSLVSAAVEGRGNLGEVFKGIAMDFASFFIQQALASLLNVFIPGLGSILGGIFDTPTNDRMAAEQGHHFAQWFTRGALAELNGGTELATGITRSSNRLVPAGIGVGGGGGSVIMHVTVTGNVMSDAYVEKTLGPKLQALAMGGRNLLALRKEHSTGARDVRTE